MRRRPLTVPTSGTVAVAEDYGDTPTPLAVWVTPDGAQVGGPGAWRQLAQLLPEAYAANWAVTDWYLDGTIGLDTNSGTTALTPLRTGAELLRRLGPYALWGQSVTVHVLANGMVDALVLRGVMLVAGTHLDVIGTPTVLASDVLGTYAPLNHATPVATQITGTAIVDWTPYQWLKARNTTPPRQNHILWIATANPAGAGIATARTTVPAAINLISTSSVLTSGTAWVAGDNFEVESLPFVPAITLAIDGPISQAAIPQYDRRQVLISGIDVSFLDMYCSSKLAAERLLVLGCRLDQWSFAFPPVSTVSYSNVYACLIGTRDASTAQHRLQNSSRNCLYGAGLTSIAIVSKVVLNVPLFQNCPVNAIGGHGSQINGAQVFDCTGGTSVAFQPCSGAIVSLSGNGNAGYGVGLNNTTVVQLLSTINLQGNVSNGRLTSAPATSLTLPQLLQSSDYAQKGTTAAMVAGTITVTVPWYDNAAQKVTASHAAFAGTPGILSVQQISTTQFTITSSSAIDTSTVNWQISPLGRNIFISTT